MPFSVNFEKFLRAPLLCKTSEQVPLAQNTSFKIILKSNINTVWVLTPILRWHTFKKNFPNFHHQKEAFYEDEYDQVKELQNGKGKLVLRVITK